MKLMSLHEGREMGLKEKVICKAGDRLVKIAMDPRGCPIGTWYEPELTSDMIEEMIANTQ